jgi:HK97 family phage major capsid protein
MSALLNMAREKRAALVAPATDIITKAESENRDLTDAEFATIKETRDANKDAIAALDERIAVLEAEERAKPAPAPAPVGGARVTRDETTYHQRSASSHIADVIAATIRNDQSAWDRLHRHASEVDVETRAIDRTSDAAFTPPLWLLDEYGDYPRPGRVIANLCRQMDLPVGYSSIVLPKITTGVQVAAQTADNANVQSTDQATNTVTVPVRTIAGQQDVALQLVEQSAGLTGGIDGLIYSQLLADYERLLGLQIWNGTGANGQLKGILQTTGIGAVTYTDASPTVPELYSPVMQALNSVETNSYLPPNAMVWAPRRWNWAISALDSSNRPLVVPTSQGVYMALGSQANNVAQGYRGDIASTRVFVDAACPTTLGGGTEDAIIVGNFDHAILMEGQLRARAMTEVLSGSLTVRFQVYRYVAFTAETRPTAFAKVTGTGLAQPTGF